MLTLKMTYLKYLVNVHFTRDLCQQTPVSTNVCAISRTEKKYIKYCPFRLVPSSNVSDHSNKVKVLKAVVYPFSVFQSLTLQRSGFTVHETWIE